MKPQNMNIDALSIDELIGLRDKIEARIEKVARSEAETLKNRLAKLEPFIGSKPSSKPRKKQAQTKRAPSAMKGKKVEPKFRDPDTGKTWSGRGMVPVWLREHEEAGRKREEFAV